ncbi:hypothetical protein C2G38_2232396 [Gigaspora rosea]|uniref:Uncharacterized protein n=1 Tax=Gigaspora rosea TaxID=44941 RepID=A0A397TRZ9_9GLOM|nr:hypothetical protein C2G38_2232396 [Gigaspora rosea]
MPVMPDTSNSIPDTSSSTPDTSSSTSNTSSSTPSMPDTSSSTSDTSSSTSSIPTPAPTLPGTQLVMTLVLGPTAASSLLAICAISIIGGGITRMFAQKESNVNIITDNDNDYNNGYKELEGIMVDPNKITTQQYTYI